MAVFCCANVEPDASGLPNAVRATPSVGLKYRGDEGLLAFDREICRGGFILTHSRDDTI
jgi:hypothetical protein